MRRPALRSACGLSAAAAATALAITLTPVLVAQSEAPPTPAEAGGLLYRIHCASCHGGGGRGDGAMTRYLNLQPADLTRLRERNAGVFPAERLRRTIDGRDEVPGHGTREMPVWGATFRSLGDVGQPAEQLDEEVSQRIELLVAHLATLQPAAPAP